MTKCQARDQTPPPLSSTGLENLCLPSSTYPYRVRERPPQTWAFWSHTSNAARFEAANENIVDGLQLPGRTVIRSMCFNDRADEESGYYTQRQHGQGAASVGTRSRLTIANLLPQSQKGFLLQRLLILLRRSSAHLLGAFVLRGGTCIVLARRSISLAVPKSGPRTSI